MDQLHHRGRVNRHKTLCASRLALAAAVLALTPVPASAPAKMEGEDLFLCYELESVFCGATSAQNFAADLRCRSMHR
jgi:hypothetical protein